MKYEQKVQVETQEYICFVKRIDGVVAQKNLVSELIRCKDCKHYYEKEWVVGGGSYTTCWYQTIANAQPNDFCSRAERKEE